jgi:hypothetical protein
MSTVRLAELLPAGITVCVAADRGFGDQKLYRMLNEELCFEKTVEPASCAAPRSQPIVTGWHRDLRAGPGHDAGLVPGRQQ